MNRQLIFLFFLTLPAHVYAQTNAPAGMVWVDGGKTLIGSNSGAENEKPAFETHLAGFWLDQNPVTVGDFKKFIRFTQYITSAEKVGYGLCYDSTSQAWRKVKGANWQYPEGKAMPIAPVDAPVRQISWQDAQAYATWIGKRLPSELEWERALQAQTNLKLTHTQQDIWQWCENWYFDYEASGYYTAKLNRTKSLRAGKKGTEARTSLRHSAYPDEFAFNMGFRCAKDK